MTEAIRSVRCPRGKRHQAGRQRIGGERKGQRVGRSGPQKSGGEVSRSKAATNKRAEGMAGGWEGRPKREMGRQAQLTKRSHSAVKESARAGDPSCAGGVQCSLIRLAAAQGPGPTPCPRSREIARLVCLCRGARHRGGVQLADLQVWSLGHCRLSALGSHRRPVAVTHCCDSVLAKVHTTTSEAAPYQHYICLHHHLPHGRRDEHINCCAKGPPISSGEHALRKIEQNCCPFPPRAHAH